MKDEFFNSYLSWALRNVYVVSENVQVKNNAAFT
jgi:hypothetical protein